MRKLLLGLISAMLLALSIYTVICGFSIGSLEIKSVTAIKEANIKLDNKIKNASELRTKTYPQNVTQLETQYKKLMSEKESYEQLLELGVDENGLPLNKIQEYEIEKIWVTMGIYAKKQGVDLKMDISSNNSISKTYDLKFTATGGYIQITDFLYDVERDSTLVFKIEDFKMVPGSSTENLSATFTCKDIKINITESTNNTTTDDKETQETDKNTTNSTQNNSSSKTNTNTTNNNTTNTNTNSSGDTNTTNRSVNTTSTQ